MEKEALLKQISDNFNLTSDEAEAALLLLDTRAANLDLSLDEYIEAYHPAGFSQKETGLSPEYKGYVRFLADDAKAIIKTGKTADFSTFVHEQAHIFRRQLAGDLKAKAEKAFKVENGKWSREQEEYFAIGFEEYIRLRMASSEDLRQVFERGARCMQHIYNGLDRIVELNPEIIKVYDELFTDSRFHFKQDEFEKTIKDIKDNSLEKFEASHVYLGMTPPIYQELGFERLPVMATALHIKSAMLEVSENPNIHPHNISAEVLKQIPEAIKKPIAILQSATVPEDIVSIVSVKDKKGQLILIPFSANKKGFFNGFKIDINLAKSIYGKDTLTNFLKRAFKENRILFINEKSQVLAIPEVQFFRNQGSQLFYDNIARYQATVKQKRPDFAKLFQAASFEEAKTVRQQYIGTDKYLKAPNGADTNLSAKQWLQVRTPSFKKWFGDWENNPESASKVLDENGEPLVGYHGTIRQGKRFSEFDTTNAPAWVSEDKEYAKLYYSEKKFYQRGDLYHTYVNIKNPFDVGDIDWGGTSQYEYLADLLGEKEDKIKKVLPENALYVYQLTNTKAFVNLLQEKGYDGITAQEHNHSTFAAFESNQIKSATENIGSFDMANNNILLQRSSYYSRETQKEKRAEDINKIAGYFIKAIETNTAPWMKPWKAHQYIDDFNPVTKTTYKGINSVILPFIRETEFHSNDPRWYTFNNAKEQNFMVKKGEKATPIVFYGTVPIGKDGKALAVDEEGKPIGDVVRFRPTLRFYKVFHASQLGVPQFDKDGNLLRDKTGAVISTPIEAFDQSKIETIDFKPIASAEKLLQQSGAKIYHDQTNRSFYNPANDSIHLCPKEQYIGEAEYYGTALHELTHWTGAQNRLNRDLEIYSLSETARAREELIAEIGSYALCKDLKLDFNPQNSAAYVQSWCEFLHDKPEEIMKATHAALEAKEYIQGFEHTKEKTTERENINTGIGPDNLHRGNKEGTSAKKQTEFDFSGKEIPCYNPTNGKLYQTQEFENHLKAINSDDKRYLSQNEIIKLGFSIKSNARPILLKTEKEAAGKIQFNYELLYNGKDIAGLPPAIGQEKEQVSVRQPVRSIKASREKEYGMEIG